MKNLENVINTIFAELTDPYNTRNWLIALDIRNGIPMVIYSGRPGHAPRYVMGGFLSDLAKVHRRWFYFSHKATYAEALAMLKEAIERV